MMSGCSAVIKEYPQEKAISLVIIRQIPGCFKWRSQSVYMSVSVSLGSHETMSLRKCIAMEKFMQVLLKW